MELDGIDVQEVGMSNENLKAGKLPEKRKYHTPKLLAYGALRELTRNGTATTKENFGQGRCGTAYNKSGKTSC